MKELPYPTSEAQFERSMETVWDARVTFYMGTLPMVVKVSGSFPRALTPGADSSPNKEGMVIDPPENVLTQAAATWSTRYMWSESDLRACVLSVVDRVGALLS
jgi:hypothetical protein